MKVDFNFWTPTKVHDWSFSSEEPTFHNIIKGTIIKIAEWTDKFFYLGNDDFNVLYSPRKGSHRANHDCLEGRARLPELHNQIEISKNLPEISDKVGECIKERSFQNKRLHVLIFKTAIFAMFFPAFLIVKACYKYLYVKSFFDQYPVKPIELDELIETYPNDPDLLTLRLSNQYFDFISRTSFQPETFYHTLRTHVDNIKENMRLHPKHVHARKLFKNCLNIHSLDYRGIVPNEQESEQDLKANSEQWFDFFGYIKKESEALKISENNDSPFMRIFKNVKTIGSERKKLEALEKEFEVIKVSQNLPFMRLFQKVKTAEDKANFRAIYKFTSFIHSPDESLVYNFFNGIHFLAIQAHLGEDRTLAIINWLIDKEDIRLVTKYGNTPLSIFYTTILQNTPRPHKQNLVDLENRFLQIDEGFTQEYRDRKLLANIFGINGNTELRNIKISLDGFSLGDGSLADEDPFPFKHSLKQIIYPELKLVLKDLLQKSSYKDKIAQLQDLIEKKESADFSSLLCSKFSSLETMGHGWSQVYYKGLLLLGNQGYGCGNYPGIIALKVNSEKFKSSNSSKFNLDIGIQSSLFGLNRKAFLKQEYFEGLNPKWLGHFPLPYQRVGNCPWKAFKLNILSLLFIICAGEDLEKGESFNTLQKRCRGVCISITKEIVDQIRVRMLEKYLTKHSNPNCNQEIEYKLLNNIAVKASQKNWLNVQRALHIRNIKP
ncbi:MAG: hypothetical protein H0W88_12045 [Parachlamydiaceae bacterium]|nr:hypothetical protein [Parachlamydiaceae bacterium]